MVAWFFVILFIYTKLAGPLPFSVTSVTTQKSTTFDVTGEGKSSIKPDLATVTAGVSVQASTVKAAQDQMNSVINKVSEVVKKTGVDSKDIQTTNYNINPNYDYTGTSQRVNGYSASTNLSIKVRTLDNVNKVIDEATANGANQINGVNFEVEDKTKAENDARQKAVEEAKKKADQAAKIAGFKLGRIINYSENFGGGIRPMPVMELSKAAGAPTQVEPGSTEVTVNVTLSYEIQ
ncbi:SIMPL domain-containing protein [Candidatus Daviesbacteria bacterium]|nr:SIMPL domain-containing protein [Candidatus Daviesbacteria bacterium]